MKNPKTILYLVATALLAVSMNSCDKKQLDIQQNYPFDVAVLPVPGEIAKGQKVELRVEIKPKGTYQETQYSIRYFQFEGEGMLQLSGAPPYKPNDLYSLAGIQFRLYYTSKSDETQSFDVWISDQFGNEQRLTFEFKSVKGSGGTPVWTDPKVPTGPPVGI